MDVQTFFDDQVFQPGFSTWVIDSTLTIGNDASGYETTLFLNQKLPRMLKFPSTSLSKFIFR